MFRNKYPSTKRGLIISFWCLFFFHITINKLIAQNLIVNGSFEQTTSCPSLGGWGVIDVAVNWERPAGDPFNSPDLFSPCFNASSGSSAPNSATGFQNAYSGTNYAGMYAFGSNIQQNVQGSEMIETKLPLLKTDYVYYMRFFVSHAEYSNVKCWKLGALFSDSLIKRYSFDRLSFTPDIVNDSLNYIIDTLNWVKIDGLYVNRQPKLDC